jgi:hypothetical protein
METLPWSIYSLKMFARLSEKPVNICQSTRRGFAEYLHTQLFCTTVRVFEHVSILPYGKNIPICKYSAKR